MCKGYSEQMRHRGTPMHTGEERLKPRDLAPTRPRRGWRPRLLIALLVSLAIFCDRALVVDAKVANSTTESSLGILVEDGTLPHALDCAVDNEPVTLSKLRGGTDWASQPLGEPAWFLISDEGPSEARPPLVTSSPDVRRALLQVFRI